jgi:type I restriction enzyme S subunit
VRFVKLSDILNISMGKTPARKEQKYWGKGHKWVSIRDLSQKIVTETKEEITDLALKESGIKLVSKGTLLFSFKLTIGKMAFAGTNLYTNEAIASFVIKDPKKVESNYLYYALQSVNLVGSNQAAMGKTLNSKSLAAIEIPLPDNINDQKRIAKLLGKVEGVINQRKQNIQQLDDLLKSVFLDMFGDPVRNEKEWEKPQLKFFGKISTGNTPPRKDPSNYSNNFIEWTKTDNIPSDKMFVSTANEYLSESGVNKGRTVEKGALLVACIAGSIESIGRAALTNRTVAFNQQINAIQPFDDVHPLYLYGLFKISKSYIQNCASKGMKKIITKGEFEKIKLVKPPFETQNQFACIVEKVEVIKSQYQQSLSDLEALYGSLSQKAFKGDLDLSNIPLPEELDVTAEPANQITDEFISDPFTDAKPLIMPLLTHNEYPLSDPISRRQVLEYAFTTFLNNIQVGGEISLAEFWQTLLWQAGDYADETDLPFNANDYDLVKKQLFQAIADGKVEQQINKIQLQNEVADGNQILLKKLG